MYIHTIITVYIVVFKKRNGLLLCVHTTMDNVELQCLEGTFNPEIQFPGSPATLQDH